MSDDERGNFEGVPAEVQTICPLCGGSGMISDAKLAIIGGVPRTIDHGRPCPTCGKEGHFPGVIPPV